MISGKTAIRRALLLGVFALTASHAVAQTPSPALIVTGSEKKPSDNVLQIIDPATKKVVARVPLSGHPHQVAASADGKFAYVTEINSGSQWLNYPTTGEPKSTAPLPDDTISVVDLVEQKEVKVIKVGPGSEPHDITIVRGKVYFTAEGYKEIARYDPATDRIDWRAGVGENRVHQIAITKDATKIFIANIGSDTVAALLPWDPAFDVQPYSLGHEPPPYNQTLIHTGKGPEGIAMSPDEKEVWVLTRGNGGMSIIDTSTRKVLQTVDLNTKDPLRIAFSPDGKTVLIDDAQSGDILILDAATRKEIKRIKAVGKQIHAIVFRPDGALAYVMSEADDLIGVIDMKTLELTDRIPLGPGSDGMVWVVRK